MLRMDSLEIPPYLTDAACEDPPRWAAWLRELPSVVQSLCELWELEISGPYLHGGTSAWVAPARRAGGEALALKVAWRHDEALHEADALRLWDGNGTVRLHSSRELDRTLVLLLERCEPGTELGALVPEPEQDQLVADLLRRVWITPPPAHRFRSLAKMCDAWATGLERAAERAPAHTDPGLVRAALEALHQLPRSSARAVLLFTDLHAANVLAAEREPWLAIDPKPYVGDPAYDTVQHMLNCRERLDRNPRGLARRMAELTGCDPDRVGAWLFARCVQEAIDDPGLVAVARALHR
jgi:streptomycin 6-kinase